MSRERWATVGRYGLLMVVLSAFVTIGALSPGMTLAILIPGFVVLVAVGVYTSWGAPAASEHDDTSLQRLRERWATLGRYRRIVVVLAVFVLSVSVTLGALSYVSYPITGREILLVMLVAGIALAPIVYSASHARRAPSAQDRDTAPPHPLPRLRDGWHTLVRYVLTAVGASGFVTLGALAYVFHSGTERQTMLAILIPGFVIFVALSVYTAPPRPLPRPERWYSLGRYGLIVIGVSIFVVSVSGVLGALAYLSYPITGSEILLVILVAGVTMLPYAYSVSRFLRVPPAQARDTWVI